MHGDMLLAVWMMCSVVVVEYLPVVARLVPELVGRGIALEQIAVLSRTAKIGDNVAEALEQTSTPFARADANAMIKRNSRLARLIEGCAAWVSGGWRDANPPFERLLRQAVGAVYGGLASAQETYNLSCSLFLSYAAALARTKLLTPGCLVFVVIWS